MGSLCGSETGEKISEEYQLNDNLSTCRLPIPRKTTCNLPACDTNSLTTGYYNNGNNACPSGQEVQSVEDCKNAITGQYKIFMETTTNKLSKCTINNDALFWNTSDTFTHGFDHRLHNVICKGTPPFVSGDYEIRTDTNVCPDGTELTEQECLGDEVNRVYQQSMFYNPDYPYNFSSTGNHVNYSRCRISYVSGDDITSIQGGTRHTGGNGIEYNEYRNIQPISSQPIICKRHAVEYLE
jgi:hypothetical protein